MFLDFFSSNISLIVYLGIFLEKKFITKDTFDDIKKIFDIRDLYAHNLSLLEIKKQSKSIISKMAITNEMKKSKPDWENQSFDYKLSAIARGMSMILHLCFKKMVHDEKNQDKFSDTRKDETSIS